ncbi:hypothetical protein RF177_01150, partial [Serratia marcescens]
KIATAPITAPWRCPASAKHWTPWRQANSLYLHKRWFQAISLNQRLIREKEGFNVKKYAIIALIKTRQFFVSCQ